MNCTDIGTYINDNPDYIYYVHIKRFIYTPYEQNNNAIDESVYWDYFLGKIIRAIEIPNDILLEIQRVDEEFNLMDSIEYLRLSDIRLSRFIQKED